MDPNTPDAGDGRQTVAEIKEHERRGRDAGAATYLAGVAQRGGYRIRAEDLVLERFVAPRAGQAVLDAGAGVGRHSLRIAPRVARLVCADLSAGALDVLMAEARRRGLDHVEPWVGDLAELDPALGPFDTVFSSEVLQHVPSHAERVRVAVALRRTLKPGGRLVVNVLCHNLRAGPLPGDRWPSGAYCHRFQPAELRGVLREAGFRSPSAHGLMLVPGRLARRLPPGAAAIEPWLSRLPGSAHIGVMVVAVGRAPNA